MGSGKSGASGSGANDYFGDCAGVVCVGPVDALMAIYVDGKQVWGEGEGLSADGQPNPVALSIPGYGMAYFYWGTEDQELDTVQERLLSANGHPDYRNQALLVLKGFLFGREKVSAPNVEVKVRRRPRQTLITGAAALLDADGQANPLCVIAEILTDPIFGLGRPAALFHAASWQATADELLARSGVTYISPVIERSKAGRALVDEIREYYDGWFRYDDDGLLRAGRFPHDEAPPTFTSANTLTAHDLIEEPMFEAGAWADTFNELEVKFADEANFFKDASFTLTSGYNRAVVGEPRQTQIDRPFITRKAQASAVAAEQLKVVAEPRFSGKLKVRGVKGATITAGTIFRLEHDLLSVALICRATSVDYPPPPDESVSVAFEAERGLSATPALTGGGSEDDAIAEDAEIITRASFAHPPAEFFSGQNQLLVVLAGRANPVTAGCNVHYRKADAEMFQELGAFGSFAIGGTVIADYAAATGDDNSGNLLVSLFDDPNDSDLERVTGEQTEDEVGDVAVCMFAFRGAELEILSVRQLAAADGGWSVKARRAQGGTTALDLKAGDAVWFIRRDELAPFRHESFGVVDTSPGYFKLQSFSAYGEADLVLCPEFAHVIRVSGPGNVVKFTSEGLRLSWSAVPGVGIIGYHIRRQSGTRRTWADAIPVHDGLLLASPFTVDSLPAGTNTLLIKAVDANGNESTDAAYIVTDIGDRVVDNVLETWDLKMAGWLGDLTGGYVESGTDALIADSTSYMWSVEGDPLVPTLNAPMWTADVDLMWADTLYTAMTYIDRVTTGEGLAGLKLTLSTDITGDQIQIFYREADLEDMWSATDTDLMWGDASSEMWSVGVWQPWLGYVNVKPFGSYDFRVEIGGGQVQGRIDELIAIIDVPDIYQNADNVAVLAAGTRIALTKPFTVLKVVNLTLQDLGGTAITARVIDKDPELGPLIKCYDVTDTPVDGNVDAILQGY